MRLFKQFYKDYPQIGWTLSTQFDKSKYQIEPEKLIANFTFSHFVEFMKIGDPVQRLFYEYKALQGTWRVRELKRQKETLLYERVGMSKDPKKFISELSGNSSDLTIKDVINDPYILEFVETKVGEDFKENSLEQALLNNLQTFLLELGKGFAFVARQKRIVIDGEIFSFRR